MRAFLLLVVRQLILLPVQIYQIGISDSNASMGFPSPRLGLLQGQLGFQVFKSLVLGFYQGFEFYFAHSQSFQVIAHMLSWADK